jgi:hypothetical protein
MLAEKKRESRSFQKHGMLGNLKPAPGILGLGVVDAIAIFVARTEETRFPKVKIKDRAISSRFSQNPK